MSEVYKFDNTNIYILSEICKPKEKILLTKMVKSIGFNLIECEKDEEKNASLIIYLGTECSFKLEHIKTLHHPSFVLKDYTSRVLSYWDSWLSIRRYIEENELVKL
jgi:hypothetical protein